MYLYFHYKYEKQVFLTFHLKHLLLYYLKLLLLQKSINQKSYIGPVRNQGDCGSCYAFGAIAAAEAVYNLKYDLYDTNCADFSESYLAFCLSVIFFGV
jgi:Cysteine protease